MYEKQPHIGEKLQQWDMVQSVEEGQASLQFSKSRGVEDKF